MKTVMIVIQKRKTMKQPEWEYMSSEFTMALMNFHGRQGWEAFAFSPKGTQVYYRRKK